MLDSFSMIQKVMLVAIIIVLSINKGVGVFLYAIENMFCKGNNTSIIKAYTSTKLSHKDGFIQINTKRVLVGNEHI